MILQQLRPFSSDFYTEETLNASSHWDTFAVEAEAELWSAKDFIYLFTSVNFTSVSYFPDLELMHNSVFASLSLNVCVKSLDAGLNGLQDKIMSSGSFR